MRRVVIRSTSADDTIRRIPPADPLLKLAYEDVGKRPASAVTPLRSGVGYSGGAQGISSSMRLMGLPSAMLASVSRR